MLRFHSPLSFDCQPWGKALEVIAGQVTAPGATLTTLTMNSGDSATVRNADLSSMIAMLAFGANNNAAGIMTIRSPKLHDNVQGIRNRIPAGSNQPLMVPGTYEMLWPQDNLTLQLSGSAVGGQLEQAWFLNYYSDLPGSASHLIGITELQQRWVHEWTTEVPVAPGGAGGYSGAVAINSTFDNFKANTDYALLGWYVDVLTSVVGFRSPDFANLRVGGPGLLSARWITGRWFYHLSQHLNLPLIPVFNAANKASTIVDVMANQAGAAVNVTAVLVELAGGLGSGS